MAQTEMEQNESKDRTRNTSRVTIYGLVHPDDPYEVSYIRYVGKANNVKARLKNHIYQARYSFRKSNRRFCEWLKSILFIGQEPVFIVLEECSAETWQEREKYWIACLREKQELFNILSGGNGVASHSEEMRQYFSRTRKGRKHSQRARHRISEGQKGRIGGMQGKRLSEEAKLKISMGNRGKRRTVQMRRHLSVLKMGVPGLKHSEETKWKISIAHLGKTASEEARLAMKRAWLLRKKRGEIPWNKGRKDIYSALV
ncbi:GIY-YIG nuclease family protein [Patescibacteria group bacterium]|nr:GIY-YIG nuclease family protein [Patescibacteria group bacterium]